MVQSLAQLVLKLTSPGVADLYQGNELWDFSLVDPDNRRDVDFARRRALLDELLPLMASIEDGEVGGRPAGRSAPTSRGRPHQAVRHGNRPAVSPSHPDVLLDGSYVPLQPTAPRPITSSPSRATMRPGRWSRRCRGWSRRSRRTAAAAGRRINLDVDPHPAARAAANEPLSASDDRGVHPSGAPIRPAFGCCF